MLLHPLPCYSASHIYVLFRRSHTRRVTWHEMKENTEGEEGWPPTVLWHIIQDCQWSSLFSNSAQLQPPLNTRQGHIVVQLEVEVWTPHCGVSRQTEGIIFPWYFMSTLSGWGVGSCLPDIWFQSYRSRRYQIKSNPNLIRISSNQWRFCDVN